MNFSLLLILVSVLFAGVGTRVIHYDKPSPTIVANTGGIAVIDDEYFYGGSRSSWVERYHKELLQAPTTACLENTIPSYVRRLTYREIRALQTFPEWFEFKGSMRSKYRQIGNAVPCGLSYAVAEASLDLLEGDIINKPEKRFQLSLLSK